MTGLNRGIHVEHVRLAKPRDYRLMAEILGCSKLATELRCRRHNGVWLRDRCMVANAVANRLGSKILQMEHRITELSNRPTAHDAMVVKQEGHREGYMEAMEVVRRIDSPARAWFVLKKHWKENYGSLKKGLRES